MPKVSNIAHVNGGLPKVKRKYERVAPNTNDILKEIIDTDPGLIARELRGKLEHKLNRRYNDVSSILLRMADAGKVRRFYQDGFWRYYPSNYLTAEERRLKDSTTTSNVPARPEVSLVACSICGKRFPKTPATALSMHRTRMHTGKYKKKMPQSNPSQVSLRDDVITGPYTPFVKPFRIAKDDWTYTKQDVIAMAKDYVWEKNDFSLKNFVEWLEKQ